MMKKAIFYCSNCFINKCFKFSVKGDLTMRINNIKLIAVLLIIWNILDASLHIIIQMAETLRICGNIIGILVALYLLIVTSKKHAQYILTISIIAILLLNIIHISQHGYMIPSLLFIGVSLLLLLILLQIEIRQSVLILKNTRIIYLTKWWFTLIALFVSILILVLSGPFGRLSFTDLLHNGELVNADYWSLEPKILSAGMGFDNIIGIDELTQEAVKAAGGSWNEGLICTNGEEPSNGNFTSTVSADGIPLFFKGYADYDDGLPVVFSWPVATETVDVTDFKFTLNTGDVVFANSVGMIPNWELNERNTVVLFGDFGNRYTSDHPDAVFPVRLDIVKDDTPLLLIGPNGFEFNAVGLSWTTNQSPYDSGPKLVGAKLNHINSTSEGEGGLTIFNGILTPNDEVSLYDEGDFRLRLLTTGGFSPDGVSPLLPNMYEDFFRIHALDENGETVYLEEIGVDYHVAGGTLRIIGLSDLGKKEDQEAGIFYDGCYIEDRDNYIDIIIAGDEAAARNITYVEIPGLEGGYNAFYNPGGPGPSPTEGVTYTAPGPADLEPVIIALDDPWRVSRKPTK